MKEEKEKKEEQTKKEKPKKEHHLWQDFKKFVTRGNVVDMAVGVIMGGAFGAIVTSVVNILLGLCTWQVPGGLKGLVTVLPAANAAQAGVSGIGQTFDMSSLPAQTIAFAASQGVTITPDTPSFMSFQTALLGKYTLHGTSYYFNGSAIIDWGTFINAIISFLVIAITLFAILKIFTYLSKKREESKAKAEELYFEKHPEERPVPVEPGKPAPTEVELLAQINQKLSNLSSCCDCPSSKPEEKK